MQTIQRVSALAAMVVALSCAATVSASAQTYSLTENFETATVGDTVQSLFTGIPITVSYAGFVVDSWESDTSDPQLAVGSNSGNKVIAGEDGPIIFQLAPDVNFETFTIDVLPVSGASTTASYFLQTAAGYVGPAITFDQTVGGTLSITSMLGSGYNTIVLPGGAQYDTVVLRAVTVPEANTLILALPGVVLAGIRIARRRK